MKLLYGTMGALWGVVFGTAVFVVVTEALAPYVSSGKTVFLLLGLLGILIAGGFGIDISLRALHHLKQPVSGRVNWIVRKVLLTVGLFFGVPCVSLGLIAASDAYHSTPPSDGLMLANFHRHRAVFDTLLAMTRHDKKLDVVRKDWTDPSAPETVGVPPERIAEYHRLLGLANVQDGYELSPDGSVVFNYWGIGSAFASDTGKGYAYLPHPPPRLLTRLDGNVPKHLAPETSYFAYRHIEGNWYVEYDCEAE